MPAVRRYMYTAVFINTAVYTAVLILFFLCMDLFSQGSPKGLQQTREVGKSRRRRCRLRRHRCLFLVRERLSGRNCRPCPRGHGLGFLRVNKKMNRVKARIAFALIPLAGILLAMTACGLFSPTMCICQQQSCGSLLEPRHCNGD